MHTGNTQGDSYFRLNINIENNPLCSCDNGRAGFPYAVSYAVPGCPHKRQSTGWSSLRRSMGICFARSHPVDWCVLSSFVPRSRSERSHVRLAASKCPDCQVFRPRSGSGRADVRFATDLHPPITFTSSITGFVTSVVRVVSLRFMFLTRSNSGSRKWGIIVRIKQNARKTCVSFPLVCLMFEDIGNVTSAC